MYQPLLGFELVRWLGGYLERPPQAAVTKFGLGDR